jgi:hypothetical protein
MPTKQMGAIKRSWRMAASKIEALKERGQSTYNPKGAFQEMGFNISPAEKKERARLIASKNESIPRSEVKKQAKKLRTYRERKISKMR